MQKHWINTLLHWLSLVTPSQAGYAPHAFTKTKRKRSRYAVRGR